jgi:hypothetical protein
MLWIPLREDLELRLRTGEILAAVIGLGELQPHFWEKCGGAVLFEELRGEGDYFCRGVSGRGRIFEPDQEVIGTLGGDRRGLRFQGPCKVLACFVEAGPRGVKGDLRQRHPCFRGAGVLREIAQVLLQRRACIGGFRRRVDERPLQREIAL